MDDDDALRGLLRRQSGVVSRRQVLVAGADDDRIDRMLRRREWSRVHRGVYLDHTGEPTWEQRAWAAVLVHPVAALDAGDALRAFGVRTGARDGALVRVVVPAGSRVRDPAGVRSRQLVAFDRRCQLHLAPPRLRLEEAVLRVAGTARDDDAAVAALGDVVQTGRTTPARLRDAATRCARLRSRGLLLEVLDDVGVGALSALERRYLRDVERPHGLPTGRRQVRTVTGAGVSYCDVTYDDHDVLVELDGELGHSSTADRWHDLERDLASAAAGRITLRAGWRQVLDPCRLARTVAAVLETRGRPGTVDPCPRCPAVPTVPAVSPEVARGEIFPHLLRKDLPSPSARQTGRGSPSGVP